MIPTRHILVGGLLVALGMVLGGCSPREEPPPPRLTFGQIEEKRIDILPVSHRSRAAMGAEADGAPDGSLSTVVSLDSEVYRSDDPIYLTLLWVNNSPRPVRICRRIFLMANFDALIFLNDEVRVIPGRTPPKPEQTLREQDFVVLEPYGEFSEVIDLKAFPGYGLSAGWNQKWGYDLSRRGRYKLRVSLVSLPRAIVPAELLGDPEVVLWEGSTLSNIVEFRVRK